MLVFYHLESRAGEFFKEFPRQDAVPRNCYLALSERALIALSITAFSNGYSDTVFPRARECLYQVRSRLYYRASNFAFFQASLSRALCFSGDRKFGIEYPSAADRFLRADSPDNELVADLCGHFDFNLNLTKAVSPAFNMSLSRR